MNSSYVLIAFHPFYRIERMTARLSSFPGKHIIFLRCAPAGAGEIYSILFSSSPQSLVPVLVCADDPL